MERRSGLGRILHSPTPSKPPPPLPPSISSRRSHRCFSSRSAARTLAALLESSSPQLPSSHSYFAPNTSSIFLSLREIRSGVRIKRHNKNFIRCSIMSGNN